MHDAVKLETCKSYVSARIWIFTKLQSDMTWKIIKQVCVYELEQYCNYYDTFF